MATLINTTWRTARVAHICDFCDLQIKPGEIYRRDAVKDGGLFYTWTTDEACAALMEHVRREVDVGSAYDYAEMAIDEPGCPEIVRARWVVRDGDVVDLRREAQAGRGA